MKALLFISVLFSFYSEQVLLFDCSILIVLFIVENHLCIYTNVFSKLFAWTRCYLTGIYLILTIPFMRMCSCRNELYKFSSFFVSHFYFSCVSQAILPEYLLQLFHWRCRRCTKKERKCIWWTKIKAFDVVSLKAAITGPTVIISSFIIFHSKNK